MRTENSTEPLHGSTAPWPKLLPAIIGIIALCATSCRSPAQMTTTSRHQSDSLQSAREYVLTLLPVPHSAARTKLPMSLLATLPTGAAYTTRSGRATAAVTRGQGDTLIITATCDSLARQVIALRQELTRIRSQTAQEVEPPPPATLQQRPTGWQWFQIWTGRLALAIAAVMLLKRHSKKL